MIKIFNPTGQDRTANLTIDNEKASIYSAGSNFGLANIDNLEEGQPLAIKQKTVDIDNVEIYTRNLNIVSSQDISRDLTIMNITYADGLLSITVEGHNADLEGQILTLSGTGGFSVNINGDFPVSFVEIVGETTVLSDARGAMTGTWNEQGELYIYYSHYIRTRESHSLTMGQKILIDSEEYSVDSVLDPYSISVIIEKGYVIQSQVIEVKDLLQIILAEPLPILPFYIPYAGRITGFTDSGTEVVIYGDLSGNIYTVDSDTSLFLQIQGAYYTGEYEGDAYCSNGQKMVNVYARTGETVEYVDNQGSSRRFKTIHDALDEYDGGVIKIYDKGSPYNEGTINLEALTHFHLESGVIIEATGTVFNTSNGITITGNGKLKSTSGSVIYSTNGKVNVALDEIEVGNSGNFYAVSVTSADNCVFSVNKHKSASWGTLRFRSTLNTKNLVLNFGEIETGYTSIVVTKYNGYVNGSKIKVTKYGHCFSYQGNGNKMTVNVPYFECTVTEDSIYNEIITLEDVTDDDSHTKQLDVYFAEMRLTTGGDVDRKSPVCRTILGKMNLYNGTIYSDAEEPAVSYSSFCSGKMQNVTVKNTAGKAADIGNYNGTFEGVTYNDWIEVISCRLSGVGDYCVDQNAHDTPGYGQYAKTRIIDSTLEGTLNGILVSIHNVSMFLDNVLFVSSDSVNGLLILVDGVQSGDIYVRRQIVSNVDRDGSITFSGNGSPVIIDSNIT